MFLETGAVRQKTAERDGNAACRRRNGEVDIAVDVAIEIELACVHELHHRDAGEKLRDRSRPHQRRVSGEWLPGVDVRETIAFGEDRTIGLHHDDDRARALVLVDPLRHQRVDHVGDIGRR
jgi:hypothetical protein